MNRSRIELKVGVFVLVCLALMGGLLLRFSKGTNLFEKTYRITLNAANVGGLRPRATVQLSGVVVGSVSEIKLAPSGTNVAITLRILSEYTIKDDARFAVEQSGFLGDQYVAVYPENYQGKPYADGAIATAEVPFNIQEFTRAAAGFVTRIDGTARRLDDAIANIQRDLLNQHTLTNLAYTVDTLQKVTESAVVVVDNLNSLVTTNAAPIGAVVSNLNTFSLRLNALADSAQRIVDTNRPDIAAAVSNLQVATMMLTNLMHEAESGKGLAGALLRNEELVTNLTLLTDNLAAAAGNLRSNGLWAFLWHPKAPETNQATARDARRFPGKNPTR